LMCQCDEMEENLLGNIKESSIYAIWHGGKLSEMRRLHTERKGHLTFTPCRHCAYPRSKEMARELTMEKRKIKIDKYAGRKDFISSSTGSSRA